MTKVAQGASGSSESEGLRAWVGSARDTWQGEVNWQTVCQVEKNGDLPVRQLEIIKYISWFERKERGNLPQVGPSILGSAYANVMNVHGCKFLF